MGQTWTQSSFSQGMFSTTSPATITSMRTLTPSEQMFCPVTSVAGSQHVQSSVKMCRGHIQQNCLLHYLSFTALANLQTKYRQTLSRSALSPLPLTLMKLLKFQAAEDLASENYIPSFLKSYSAIHLK